jgi:hypothetical protein
MIPPQEDHADELDVSHHSRIDGRGIVPFDADLPVTHWALSATLAARQGATTKELMRRLGHTTADMAMRYQRAETDRDRALANAMSEQVARAAHSVPSAETGNGSAI